MSNISNYQDFEKEAKLNVQTLKNIGRSIKGVGRQIVKTPEDAKYISKNLDEFASNISKSGLKTKDSIDKIIKDNSKTDFGLTGMLASGAKSGAKWVGKKTYKVMPKDVKQDINKVISNPELQTRIRVGKRDISKARERFDKGITNLDMKLGGLGYKYAPGKTKNLFVGTKKIELQPRNKSGAKEYADFKVTRISEPVKKTSNLVVPIAGGMYLTDKLEKLKYKTPEAQALDEIESKNASTNNEDAVIDKVSYMLENKDVKENTNNISTKEFSYYLNKMSKLASQASTQLKLASDEYKSLKEKISQLEVEKSLIKIAYENEARERNAKELATEMVEKGIIKKAHYEEKVKDLYQMDKKSFEIFKKTIDDIDIEKQASDCKDGVDSLQFILGSSSPTKEKVSMEEAFSQF